MCRIRSLLGHVPWCWKAIAARSDFSSQERRRIQFIKYVVAIRFYHQTSLVKDIQDCALQVLSTPHTQMVLISTSWESLATPWQWVWGVKKERELRTNLRTPQRLKKLRLWAVSYDHWMPTVHGRLEKRAKIYFSTFLMVVKIQPWWWWKFGPAAID